MNIYTAENPVPEADPNFFYETCEIPLIFDVTSRIMITVHERMRAIFCRLADLKGGLRKSEPKGGEPCDGI